MIPDRDNSRIVAVFHHDYARAFTLHSDDHGATWSKPAEITDVFHAFKPDYPWVVCANGCGHGFQLRNGWMIVVRSGFPTEAKASLGPSTADTVRRTWR